MNKKSQEKKIIYCILLRLTHRRRAVSQAIEILLKIYMILLFYLLHMILLFSCCFEEMAGNTSTVREVSRLFCRVSYEDKHISKMVTCLLNQRLKCVDYYF